MKYAVTFKKNVETVEEIEFPLYYRKPEYEMGCGYKMIAYYRWNTPTEVTCLSITRRMNSIEYEIHHDPTTEWMSYASEEEVKGKNRHKLTKEQFDDEMQKALDFIKSKM